MIAVVTAFEHLVTTHILFAETLAIATTESLGPDNELRMLLNPHMQGTMKINMGASNNLFPTNSLVHRASPFDEAGFMAPDGRGNGILWAKTVVLRYTRFEDTYRTYHESQRFIRQFWRLSDPATPDFWPSEFRRPTCHALTELLTEVIFGVSGWHRHVGSVADFFRDTRFASTNWQRGETNTRPAQTVMVMLLAQSTNAILPKFSDELSEVIYGDHEALAENFRIFNRRMLEIQGILEHRNQERQAQNDIPYRNMEPESVEHSVAV